MVELAKALTLEEHAAGHLVILLDEPTSVLERAEIDILFARVRALKSRASFVFVSHRLDEVLELSDRVYVMKDGAVVAELAGCGRRRRDAASSDGRPDACRRNIISSPCKSRFRTLVVLEADGLGVAARPTGTSAFKLHAGEILGIAGVIGSGREELTRTLAGFAPHTAGRLAVAGREVAACDARRRGRPRHRLYPERAAGRGAGAFPVRLGQHHAWPISPASRATGLIDGREERSWRETGLTG